MLAVQVCVIIAMVQYKVYVFQFHSRIMKTVTYGHFFKIEDEQKYTGKMSLLKGATWFQLLNFIIRS